MVKEVNKMSKKEAVITLLVGSAFMVLWLAAGMVDEMPVGALITAVSSMTLFMPALILIRRSEEDHA